MARAEALGFDSAWTQEQVLGSMPHLGPIETMTYAAACTERLRLGCAVFVLPLHSPVHLAKGLSTLDQLSRGRLEVGVGFGGRRMFSAFAVDPDRLVTRFVEALQLMKALWTEPRVTFKGRFWRLDGAAMEPKPFQKPYPPVWFGGAPSGTAMGSSAPGHSRPPDSPSRCGFCETPSRKAAGRPAGFGSPNVSTSRWTTTPRAPANRAWRY